jgi:hypothetical protein
MAKEKPPKKEDAKKSSKQINKDYQLKSIKILLEHSLLENFDHLFALYPASSTAKDINMGYTTIRKRIVNPNLLNGLEVQAWANLIGTEEKTLQEFINAEKDRVRLRKEQQLSSHPSAKLAHPNKRKGKK